MTSRMIHENKKVKSPINKLKEKKITLNVYQICHVYYKCFQDEFEKVNSLSE